jgi:hypothetical protein
MMKQNYERDDVLEARLKKNETKSLKNQSFGRGDASSKDGIAENRRENPSREMGESKTEQSKHRPQFQRETQILTGT